MKKKLGLLMVGIIVVLVVLSVSGVLKRPLTVYVDSSVPLYREAVRDFKVKNAENFKVKIVSFDSYEEMKTRLNSEIMSGKGPDVLLFNGIYDVDDSFKTSASGSLLALDERMSELEEENYFTNILDAGIVNGHQYFLPLSWNILQAYSSQGVIAEKGYNDDMFAAYMEEAAALANDNTMGVSSLTYGRADGSRMNYFLDVAGVELIDWTTGQLNDNKDEVQQVAEFVKVVSDNQEKNTEIAQRYSRDFAGAVAHFTYLTEDFPFMNNVCFYQTAYPNSVNDEMYFAPYTNLEGGITAQVTYYGAISAYTKYEDRAWKLLRHILDYESSVDFNKYDRDTHIDASVNKEVYAAYVEQLATRDFFAGGQTISPLQEKWVQVLEEIPAKVDSAIIPNGAIGNTIQECLDPYLNGEDSFDNCYATLMTRLQMYLDE